ncbi:MAG: ArnT family glycosyltransferase [Anaerolineales bacterium]
MRWALRWRPAWISGALIVLAIVTRFGVIGAGLPGTYDLDELLVMRGVVPQAGGIAGWLADPALIAAYPPLALYLARWGLLIYYIAGSIGGAWSSVSEFYFRFLVAPGPFFFIARALAAVWGSATLLLVYRFARRWYGRGVAWAALALSVLTGTLLFHSRIAKPDSLLGLETVGLVYVAANIASGRNQRPYLFGGLLAGLTIATKYYGVLGLGVLLVGHALRVRNEGLPWRRVLLDGRIALLGIAVVEGFALGDPFALGRFVFLLAEPARWLGDPLLLLRALIRSFEYTRLFHAQLGWPGAPLPVPVVWVFSALASEWGWPLVVLSVLGLGYALWQRTPADLILVAWPLAAIGFFGLASAVPLVHYLLPGLPLLAVLTARVGLAIAARMRLSTGLSALVGAALLAAPVNNVIGLASDWFRPDTRALARSWIERELPWGSGIAFSYYNYAYLPQLLDARQPFRAVGEIPPPVATALQAYAADHATYWMVDLQDPEAEPTWPSPAVEAQYGADPLVTDLYTVDFLSGAELARAGVRYVLLSSTELEVYDQPNPHAPDNLLHYSFELQQAAYQNLQGDPELRLLKTFAPDADRSGPAIYLYEVSPPG